MDQVITVMDTDKRQLRLSVLRATTALWELTRLLQQMAAQVLYGQLLNFCSSCHKTEWSSEIMVLNTCINHIVFSFQQETFARREIIVSRDPVSQSPVEMEPTWTTLVPPPVMSVLPVITVSIETGPTSVARVTTAPRALELTFSPAPQERSETPQDSITRHSALPVQVFTVQFNTANLLHFTRLHNPN